MLHLPEDESIVLSGPATRRLLQAGDGDAALLYIAVLRHRGGGDDEKIRATLNWPKPRFDRALQVLMEQGLLAMPAGKKAEIPPPAVEPTPMRSGDRPEYTRADMARALEGQEFSGLTRAVEDKLGKKLTTPDVAILLGLYDDVGLPADVIYLLVNFCVERSARQYGPGRRPTLRQIEREGYTWARLGLMNQEQAAAYIKKYQRGQEALPRMMRLLGLGERKSSATEEKYLISWSEMGFEDAVIERAYDKTILKCKELKWPYMDKILHNWHEKGLRTLQEVEEGDRPAQTEHKVGPTRDDHAASRENMARMEKYLRQLRQQEEGKEGQ